MIKRIVGILFALATLALLVVTVLHRERYHSLVEIENPAGDASDGISL